MTTAPPAPVSAPLAAEVGGTRSGRRRRPMARVAVRGVGAHRFRLVATMLAVVLGVSFMCGTAILGDTVEASFAEIYVDAYERVDVVVRSDRELGQGFGARRDRLDGAVVDQVAAVPGVAVAEGQVEGPLRIVDARGRPMYNPQASLPTLALSWPRAPALNGWALADGGRPPQGDDEVVLDRRSAAEGGYRVGDRVRLAVATGIVERTLVGTATFEGLDTYAGSPAVLLDADAAARLVGEPGRVDRVAVVAAPDVAPDELAARIARHGLPHTEALTGAAYAEERQALVAQFIGLFTQLIGAFGMIALFVGIFIIYNTFTIIVAQRTRELALLRAVGASRRQVLGSVLIEAGLVGAVASAIGVVSGWGVAHLLRTLIRIFGVELPDTPLQAVPGRFVLPVVLALAVTLVSAAVPAWRASRTRPVAALRSAAVDRTAHPGARAGLALPFLATAVLMVLGGLRSDADLAPGYVLLAAVPAIVAFAVAGPVFVPPVVGWVGRLLPRLTGITGRLALRNALRNPSRTATTASALLIGVSLVCVVTVAAASLSATVQRTIERTVSAGDFIVTTDSFLGIPPSVATTLADLPEVDQAAGVRGGPVEVRDGTEFAIAVDPASAQGVVDLDLRAGSFDRLGPGTVAVAAVQAAADGVALGDRIPVRFASGEEHDVEVVAVYGRSLTRNGEYLFAHAGWDPHVPEALRVDARVLVTLADGVGADAARPALEAAVGQNPTIEILDVAEYRDQQAGQVVRRISYLYALLGLALVIGLLGIINTLLLSVHERTVELGLLRTVGARRRQLGAAVLQEALVIAALGAAVGVALGVVLGWAMVQTLTFDEQVVFQAPVGWLAAIGVGSTVAGVAAGLYPAWRAGRLELLAAVVET